MKKAFQSLAWSKEGGPGVDGHTLMASQSCPRDSGGLDSTLGNPEGTRLKCARIREWTDTSFLVLVLRRLPAARRFGFTPSSLCSRCGVGSKRVGF